MMQGFREAFDDATYGVFGVSETGPAMASVGGRLGRAALPVARGAVTRALKAALLARASVFTSLTAIAKAFPADGFKVVQHAIDRLRSVGPAIKADAGRMARLGIRNVEDVLEVIRNGKPELQSNGRIGYLLNGVRVVVENGNKIISIVLD